MKKLTILSAIALSGLFVNTANAQIRVSLGFGFAPRPVVYERPVPVAEQPVYQEQTYQEPAYDNGGDDYYYLPDVDAYYSIDQQCYYYNDGENWISAAFLPGDFRDYNWRYAPHYEVRAMRPYLHNDFYRERYNGHFAGDWGRNIYRGNNYEGYRAGRFRDNDREPYRSNRSGYNHGFDNRFSNNEGYNSHPEFNQRQFDRVHTQERNNFGGSYQHFAANGPQGGYSHRGMNRF